MTPAPDSVHPLPKEAAKLITCVLPDDGSDKTLMQALRHERRILRTSSVACRGIAVLQCAKSKHDQLPEATLVRKVDVVVADHEADAVFDYIHEKENIGHKGSGIMFMGPLINMTTFELPEGVPDEEVH